MSTWITNLLPQEEDADDRGFVATWTDSYQMVHYKTLKLGDPWVPIPKA